MKINLWHKLDKEYVMSTNYISLEQASEITGFKKTYMRDLAKRAGMTRIGSNSLLRSEFEAFFKFRSQEVNKPSLVGEDRRMRMARINREWRKLLPEVLV
jgi:hypothetical protein